MANDGYVDPACGMAPNVIPFDAPVDERNCQWNSTPQLGHFPMSLDPDLQRLAESASQTG